MSAAAAADVDPRGGSGGVGSEGLSPRLDGVGLVQRLRAWAHECGFSQIGIAGIDLASAEPGLSAWLAAGFHGSMHYMARHGLTRARPAALVPGTVSVICARMDYLPRDAPAQWIERERARLPKGDGPADGSAVVSVYARGRDYHKVLRQRLQQLSERMAAEVGPFGHRVFTDSAPVLEVELATRAGLGWRGKHTLALSRESGSTFFLGEIFVDLALPPDAPTSEHCGTCGACIDACPTSAIVAPYRLDARRCISYLTIEEPGPIPVALRRALGNRVFGCDDCQLACPWNKYAVRSTLADFDERHGLGQAKLLELWAWDEGTFLQRTEGSAIRRIGFARWRRNLAVALGNALGNGTGSELGSGFGAAQGDAPRAGGDKEIATALGAAREGADPIVREHIEWALAQCAGGTDLAGD
jgi:epoxyqueuosine reductase